MVLASSVLWFVGRCLLRCVVQVIGREREVARVIQILGRRTKNNPILLGEPGMLLATALGTDGAVSQCDKQLKVTQGVSQPRVYSASTLSRMQASLCGLLVERMRL